ncbi:MAG: CRTAC1 family protein [Planctomycetota bacterium]
MLPTLALFLACIGDFASPAPLLFVREAAGFAPIVACSEDSVKFVVPLASRSEFAPRAERTARGVGFALFVPAGGSTSLDRVALAFVAHAPDEQVLRVEGRPTRIGAPRLPVSATDGATERNWLPELARRDFNSLDAARLSLVRPEGAGRSLVWIAEESLDVAHVVTADASLELALGSERVDQAFFADTQAIEASAWQPLALRTLHTGTARVNGAWQRRGEGPEWPAIEAPKNVQRANASELDTLATRDARVRTLDAGAWIELWFDAPTVSPGASATLLVTVEFAPRTRALPAAAARNEAPASERQEPQAEAEPLFRDGTRAAGLSFVHMEGPDEQLDIRPTMGPGAAWGDVDGDGWVDLFLVQGGGRDGSRTPKSVLYKNRGDGTFRDVTRASGLDVEGRGMGALFVDVDGDADLDLFVAMYGRNRLLLNDGGGRFHSARADLDLGGDRWHAAVCAADYDTDGDLDLYVTSYLRYDESALPPAEELGRYQREDPVAMLPFAFRGETKSLLRNDSQGGEVAFTDVAVALGLDDPEGRGMQAVFWDFDRDADLDLYLANDVSPNRLWRNEGGGKFKDVSFGTGMDDPRGCMGLAAGDVDGDGDEDMLVTNWQVEANALYVNNLVSHQSARHHVASFRDAAISAGLAQLSVGVTKWGCELFDADLDGDLDLFYANGYTSPDYESTGICVGQPSHYFENDGEGKFRVANERAGPAVALPLASRGAIACDFDRDGDLDLVVTANNGRARLLVNEQKSGGAWLGVRLNGARRNPFAIGAEVTLRAGERTWRRALRAGTSYLCGNAPELHFGLGDVRTIDACTVRWPDGTESRHAIECVNTFVTLAEPQER